MFISFLQQFNNMNFMRNSFLSLKITLFTPAWSPAAKQMIKMQIVSKTVPKIRRFVGKLHQNETKNRESVSHPFTMKNLWEYPYLLCTYFWWSNMALFYWILDIQRHRTQQWEHLFAMKKHKIKSIFGRFVILQYNKNEIYPYHDPMMMIGIVLSMDVKLRHDRIAWHLHWYQLKWVHYQLTTWPYPLHHLV